MRPTIVHLTSMHSAADVRVFQRECRSLARNGYRVILLAPYSRSQPVANGTIDGVEVRQFRRCRRRLLRATVTPARLLYLAMRCGGDVYHLHDPELIPVGLALRLAGSKIIYDAHENVPLQVLHAAWLPHSMRPLLSRIVRRLEMFAARRFETVVAANPDIYARFAGEVPRAVEVSNFPTAEDLASLSEQGKAARDPHLIVSFGGVTQHTCAAPMIDALALLPGSLAPQLVLGGKVASEALHAALRQRPGWRRVEYVGKVTRQKMVSHLLRASMALVLYSPEPNHYGLGSNRFFEVLAAGVPVIAPDFPAYRKLVDEIGCGLTVNPLDPEAIARAIEYLMTHPEEAAAMGKRGRRAILRRLNWHVEESKLLQVYEQVLHQSAGEMVTHAAR